MREQTTWNPMSHADYDVLKGKDVFSNDGQSVGSIVEILHPAEAMPAARGRHFFLLSPGRTKEWFGGIDQVYLPDSRHQRRRGKPGVAEPYRRPGQAARPGLDEAAGRTAKLPPRVIAAISHPVKARSRLIRERAALCPPISTLEPDGSYS